MDNYKIIWSDLLSIGDKKIDAQHKKLIELIGEVARGKDISQDELLNEVLDYASYHFADEEAYMEKINYPGLKEHRNKHKKLTKVLLTYKKEYEQGEINSLVFREFMFVWVRDHIMDEDRAIGDYLNEQKA